jgi:hypothetical protein
VRELFVWYRVDERRADAARAAVTAMQGALVAACAGLQVRLLVRRGGSGVQTWMETYSRSASFPDDPSGIDATIEAAIEAAARALQGVIDGERHVEAFEVVAPR